MSGASIRKQVCEEQIYFHVTKLRKNRFVFVQTFVTYQIQHFRIYMPDLCLARSLRSTIVDFLKVLQSTIVEYINTPK